MERAVRLDTVSKTNNLSCGAERANETGHSTSEFRMDRLELGLAEIYDKQELAKVLDDWWIQNGSSLAQW